ncbi:MAG: TlyA family RNA methyltransferase, partial [Candidatus Aminicenantes bacterium]|nr:TlyA family RNA methyltransferase [Candidatus Aminicenantes bacterium]
TDRLLVERGLAPSREKAQALVMAGLVSSGGRAVLKAGELVDETAGLQVHQPLPYVGRGGLKLEEALDRFGIDVGGAVALDVGSSTGGFTDCLLQRGAGKVYAVDVDTKQLDWGLSRDPRVVLVEKNARHLVPGDIGEAPGVVTLDLSFISLLKVLPALREIPGDWVLLALIKPQFEAGRRQVGKKGVVRDPVVHEDVLARVVEGARELGFGLEGLFACSTRGQKGNREFFARWAKRKPDLNRDLIPSWIKEAASHE